MRKRETGRETEVLIVGSFCRVGTVSNLERRHIFTQELDNLDYTA